MAWSSSSWDNIIALKLGNSICIAVSLSTMYMLQVFGKISIEAYFYF